MATILLHSQRRTKRIPPSLPTPIEESIHDSRLRAMDQLGQIVQAHGAEQVRRWVNDLAAVIGGQAS